MSLSTLIFLALGFGIAFGAGLHEFLPTWVGPMDHYVLNPLGQIFLRLIQFIVVPLVFSSLILALTRVKDAAEVGRYAVKLLGSYVVTTTIAVVLGMGTAIVLASGTGMIGIATPSSDNIGQAPDLIAWLVSLIPTNPLTALSSSNLLQTILSAALIGIGMQQAQEKAQPFAEFIASVYEISEKILIVVLYISPVGVFALMASVIANAGFGVIINLFSYVLGHIIAVALMILVYTILLLAFKISPKQFFSSFTSTYTLAFGTASSNAALPVALQEAQDNYNLPLPIASFAIPLGTAVKRDGSAIMEGFSAVFIAQLFQIPLTGSLLLSIGLSTLLVSFSTAGVPGSGLVMMATVLTAAGLPVEGVAIVAGVNRLADGFCTTLNLMGNTAHAALLAKWEGLESDTSDRLALGTAPVESETAATEQLYP